MIKRTQDHTLTFGELLKLYRCMADLSQTKLSEKIRVHRNTISKWEQGLARPDTREKVMMLCDTLILSEVDTDKLLRAAQYPVEYHTQPTEETVLPEPTVNWARLQQICHKIQANAINQNDWHNYDPQLYCERAETMTVVEAFLRSPQQILVLAGNSGVGKTNFVLSLTHQPQQDWQEYCLLLYHSGFFEVDAPLLTLLEQDFQQHGPLDNFLQTFARQPNLETRRFILIIDALNEHPQAGQLLRRLDRMVRHIDHAWFKVILTTRPESWQHLYQQARPLTEPRYYRPLNVADRNATHPDQPEAGLASPPKGGGSSASEGGRDSAHVTPLPQVVLQTNPASLTHHLPRFRPHEVGAVYANYQQKFALQSEYNALKPSIQQALRDPLILRLAAVMYQGQPIPDALHPKAIYHHYLDTLIDSGKLQVADEQFLFKQVLPLMATEGRYSNEIREADLKRHGLRWQAVAGNGHDESSFQNLVDADILSYHRAAEGWLLRFSFERFYDGFMGKYLAQQSEKQPDKLAFVERIAEQLPHRPFLWGPLRTLLDAWLEQGQVDPWVALGRSQQKHLADMMITLLIERYAHQPELVETIGWRWLNQPESDEPGQALRIVAHVALQERIETMLTQLLHHPTEAARFFVVQDIFTLWQHDPDLVRQLLTQQADAIQQLPRSQILGSRPFSTLLYSSIQLFLSDYLSKPEQLKTIPLIQEVWQPVIARSLFDFSYSPVQTIWQSAIAWGLVHIPYLHRIEKQARYRQVLGRLRSQVEAFVGHIPRERFSFDFASFQALFPATLQQQQTMQRLTAHFAAAYGQPPESVNALTDFLLSLAEQGEENFWLVYIAHLSLVAHLKHTPLATAQAISRLLDQLDQLYQPPTDPQNPTAGIWYPVMTYPFFDLRYADYAALERQEAEAMLQVFMKGVRQRAFRYHDHWRRDSGTVLKIDALETTLFGYALGLPTVGSDVLLELTDFYVRTSDHEKIAWGVYSLALGMNRYELPKEGLTALQDFIERLTDLGYFEQLTEAAYRQLWQKWADDLFTYASRYRESLADLLAELTETEVPDLFKARLQNISWQDSVIQFNFGENITWLLSNAAQDANPASPLRDLAIWFFNTSTQTPDLPTLMLALIGKLVDHLYLGRSLFPHHYDDALNS